MTTTTCDICGKALDRNNNTNVRLPSIKFTIELSDNDGPGGSKRITACNFESGAVSAGYSGIPLLWKFDTTNIHFCDECVFNAFYCGVQDEFIKRQNVKPAERLNAGLGQAFDQVFAHAPGKVPSP